MTLKTKLLSLLAIAMLALSSCEKEELTVSNDTQDATIAARQTAGTWKFFFCDPNDDDAPGDCGPLTNCDDPGDDCLNALKNADLINELNRAIEIGTVRLFFRDVVKVRRIFPAIDRVLLDEIENEQTTLRRVTTSNEDKVLYTLHDTQTGELRK